MNEQLIDVNNLIANASLSELTESADEYWKRLIGHPRLLAKPYNLGDAEHILPQLGFLIQGLQLFSGMSVLDFGAGSCYASRILNQLGMNVTSVDVSSTALEIGRQLDQRWPPVGDVPRHNFCVFDGKRLDFEDSTIDRIICLDALHHVPDPGAAVREMGRVLKNGGIAGFSEPGPNHSKTSEAQQEMRNWRVVENDIVLSKLFNDSRRHGFTDLKVSIATIHPPLVPLDGVADYLSHPTAFLEALRERTTNYPIFFLYKGDPTIRDSRSAADLNARIALRRDDLLVMRGERVKLTADVLNTSPKTWLASGPKSGCVNVGGMLRCLTAGQLDNGKEFRFHLSGSDVEPQEAINNIEIDLGALEAGKYHFEIDLVSENVCWFQSQSGAIATANIVVV